MVKCNKCSKLINKKNPGIQCNKCSKWLHCVCASISAEQLNALYTTDCVDWKCRSCAGSTQLKRISCIMPDSEDEENTTTEIPSSTQNKITQQILSDIRREVREIIRNELQTTLQFLSDKVDDYEQKIKEYENSNKRIEHYCNDLQNKCKNLDLKNEVLEQKINQLEQSQLSNVVEVCGVTESEKENTKSIVDAICNKLQLQSDSIINAYRKRKPKVGTGVKNNLSTITVTLREGFRDQWIDAAKTKDIRGMDMGMAENNKIYLREPLTPFTSYLLWKTKQELKFTEICKFVWCKRGTIMVRKEEKEKIYIVRSEKDISRLSAEFKNE